jgi:hypothetical protein
MGHLVRHSVFLFRFLGKFFFPFLTFWYFQDQVFFILKNCQKRKKIFFEKKRRIQNFGYTIKTSWKIPICFFNFVKITSTILSDQNLKRKNFNLPEIRKLIPDWKISKLFFCFRKKYQFVLGNKNFAEGEILNIK